MPRNAERGQTALLYTLATTAMFGLAGLATDVGWMYFREQAAQSAAEAAAWGGAIAALKSSPGGFTCGSSGVVCQSATPCPNPIPSPATTNVHNACYYAKDNGFQVTATSNQNVTIAANVTAPPTVSGATPEYWVTAAVTERVPQFLSAILGNATGYVSARSTAGIVGKAPAQCIYVLDPSNADVLDASGAAVLSTNCAIQVNSSATYAAQVHGSSSITGSAINVVGTTEATGTSTFSPAPNTGAPVITDPLINLPAPSYGTGCDHTNYTLSNGNTAALTQGVYCGGMTFKGESVATLAGGNYILRGGGLTISNGASVTGSGVMFYNTGDSTYPYAAVSFSGGTTTTLSAPTTGAYQGILIFQDRNITSTLGNAISNGASATLSGALYFPTTSLSFSGGSSTNIPYTALVAKSMSFTGSAYMKYDSTGARTGLINRAGYLIE